jgi:hypothetical protein
MKRSSKRVNSKRSFKKKTTKQAQQKNKKKRNSKPKSKSHKQKGGFKSCNLGYAMVQGMNLPAINNVPGEINFNDVYGRLNNNGNCNLAGNTNHPVINTN